MRYRHLLPLLVAIAAGCSDGASPTPDAGNPSDQCIGSADLAVLSPFLADGGLPASQAFTDLMEGCARDMCAGALVTGTELEAEACLSTCFDTTVIAELSAGCEECFSHSVICGMEFCTLECLGTDPDLCLACVNEHCMPMRDYCTGIPSIP